MHSLSIIRRGAVAAVAAAAFSTAWADEGGAAADGALRDYFENVTLYEAKAPALASAPAAGFHGRHVEGLEWITPTNAVGDESRRTWRTRAWRNERVHGQFVVWTDEPRAQLRASVTALASDAGARIPAGRLQTRFVRFVHNCGDRRTAPADYGDCLDTRACVDLTTNGFRAVWLTVSVPAETPAGVYRGTLTLTAGAADGIAFPVELEVVGRTLPAKTSFYLDLWQMPWSVARYHGVKPYSPLHYELLRPLLAELAAAGQGAIMTLVVDDLWPCYGTSDTGNSMVDYRVFADGRREFDFSVFDRYVDFAKSCGIGPQIHCYSFVRFQDDRRKVQTARLIDGDTGLRKTVEFHGFDDPAWEAYWGPFAQALERHAREKGWLGDVYVAIDEMYAATLERVQALLKKWAPGLKIQFASDKPYAQFAPYALDNFSQALRKDFMSEDLFADLAPRRAAGKTTTFYVCVGHPQKPNTFMNRPAAESEWMPLYAAAHGFDGFLRWASYFWHRDPFFDTAYPGAPGETFFLYPGALASVRWERMRDGIETFDKVRILRRDGGMTPGLEAALGTLRFAPGLPDASYAASVDAVNGELQKIR